MFRNTWFWEYSVFALRLCVRCQIQKQFLAWYFVSMLSTSEQVYCTRPGSSLGCTSIWRVDSCGFDSRVIPRNEKHIFVKIGRKQHFVDDMPRFALAEKYTDTSTYHFYKQRRHRCIHSKVPQHWPYWMTALTFLKDPKPHSSKVPFLVTQLSYHNVPKFSDRQVWANSVDPEEQSDQGLHSLPFRLHLLDALFYGKAT